MVAVSVRMIGQLAATRVFPRTTGVWTSYIYCYDNHIRVFDSLASRCEGHSPCKYLPHPDLMQLPNSPSMLRLH
eukprot:6103784-Amphidinium_carterae.1